LLLQIALYCAAAALCCAAFVLWRRIDFEVRQRMWLLYGWFIGVQFFGCCIGAVAEATRMQEKYLIDVGLKINAEALYWRAAYEVLHGLSSFVLIVSKVMMLDRMVDFASAKASLLAKRLDIWKRLVFAAVVMLSLAVVGSHVSVAVYASQSGNLLDSGFKRNSTEFLDKFNQADQATAAYLICESVRLMFIVASFLVVGVLCSKRILSGMKSAQAPAVVSGGKSLLLQISCTTAFVFVTLLLLTCYTLLMAYANVNTNIKSCSNSKFVCSACYNDAQLILFFDYYTPALRGIIELIAYPLSVFVAVWGMTSSKLLKLMLEKSVETRQLRSQNNIDTSM
jgi:hypothetical protein